MCRVDTDHREVRFRKSAINPLPQRAGFQANALEVVDAALQYRQQRFRLTRYLGFANDPSASSSMQTLVSLTDTSNPAKCSTPRFSI